MSTSRPAKVEKEFTNNTYDRMIHAYLFVVGGKHVRGDDPSGHGFGFRMSSSLSVILVRIIDNLQKQWH